VKLVGVGNRAVHNAIHDGRHAGIAISGNDHLIELNELARVCTETADAGAIYMGRDFTQRGTIIRHNLIRDVGAPARAHTLDNAAVVGVYLDDFASGTTVAGNVFVWAGRAVLLGGGRDNTITGNLFVNANPAIQVDQRGKGWAAAHVRRGDEWGLWERVTAVPSDRGPYLKYPHLRELLGDDPGAAKYNRIAGNVHVGRGTWIAWLDGMSEATVETRDNWRAAEADLEQVGEGRYRLAPGAAAIKQGFAPPPLAEMGRLPRRR
jgi:hypothetical protein